MKLKTSYEISIPLKDVQKAKELCAALRSVLYKAENESVTFLCFLDIVFNTETQEREAIVTIVASKFSDPMDGFHCVLDVKENANGGDDVG